MTFALFFFFLHFCFTSPNLEKEKRRFKYAFYLYYQKNKGYHKNYIKYHSPIATQKFSIKKFQS